MAEHELIQQEREILRKFREATSQRAKAEVEAEARYNEERNKEDAQWTSICKNADAQLAQAHNAMEKTKANLANVELSNIADMLQVNRPSSQTTTPADQELANSVSSTLKISETLNNLNLREFNIRS